MPMAVAVRVTFPPCSSSFLRKYSALAQESTEYLSRLFNFHPIYLEKPFFIHGAEFKAFYTLHSIPTIGFTIDFQGRLNI